MSTHYAPGLSCKTRSKHVAPLSCVRPRQGDQLSQRRSR